MKRNAYNEETNETSGYSVFSSEQEYLEQWTKENAQEQTGNIVADIVYNKLCSNGNLFIIAKDYANRSYTAFLSPALALEIDNNAVKAVIEKTPKGIEYTASLDWSDKFLISLNNKKVRLFKSNNGKTYDIIELW